MIQWFNSFQHQSLPTHREPLIQGGLARSCYHFLLYHKPTTPTRIKTLSASEMLQMERRLSFLLLVRGRFDRKYCVRTIFFFHSTEKELDPATPVMGHSAKNAVPRCHMMIAPWCCSHCGATGCRGLTWVWVIRADRAQQVLLPLVVDLTQQLALLQDKLVALPQLPVAHAAAEAVQVVDALQGAHHKLCRGDLLHAAAALCCKEPEERDRRIKILQACRKQRKLSYLVKTLYPAFLGLECRL